MLRQLLANVLIAGGLCGIVLSTGTRSARADAGMAYLHTYEFVEGASDFHLSGGFAGFDLNYDIAGSFGLLITPRPQGMLNFDIVDVQASLQGEDPFHDLPLDDLIRMSDWSGHLQDVNTIQFTGTDGQGAPMKTTGTLGDVVLLLDGANSPPCCDYFEYELSATMQITSIRPFGFVMSSPFDAAPPGPSTVPEPVTHWWLLVMLIWRRPRVVPNSRAS